MKCNSKYIGEAIKYYRTKCDITRKELAYYLGVTPSLISKWENNSKIPLKRVEDLCLYLNITPIQLFEFCNRKEKEYLICGRFSQNKILMVLLFCLGIIVFGIASLLFYFLMLLEIKAIKFADNEEVFGSSSLLIDKTNFVLITIILGAILIVFILSICKETHLKR